MNPLLSARLALALVPIATPAVAGDYLVQTLGDTAVEILDVDVYAASSEAQRPTIGLDGAIERLHVATGASPTKVVLGVDVASSGHFTLTFDGATTSRFDGKFLVGRDLTSDQDYRLRASGASAYSYGLFSGGVFVGAGPMSGGVAPFVLDRVPDAFASDLEPTPGGHAGQIDVTSFSWGGNTAIFDDGRVLTVDTVVVSGHEVGHLMGLGTIDAGRTTVHVVGVDELVVEVESAGELEAIEALVFDRALFEVRGNVGNEIADSALSTVVARFPADGLQRARFKVGGAWGPWSAWTFAPIDQVIGVPAAGERVDDYQLERRASAASPTIASSGYIRVKKLNSGG